MSRPPDSGRRRAQQEMLARLHVGGLIEHGPTPGAATERHWIALFERYLPKRYRASSAFVIDSRGNRSRQIDFAIYDHFYSPLLFPQESAIPSFVRRGFLEACWPRLRYGARQRSWTITRCVGGHKVQERLDLVCCLEHGTLEYSRAGHDVQISCAEESLIFFILRLLERLRAMGTAPAVDWAQYGRALRSFQKHT